METKSSTDNPDQHRDKEIQFLQNLQETIRQAKHELNNDLTRLAIKNMPMMLASNDQQYPLPEHDHLESMECQLSVSTIHSEQQATGLTPKGQELERLDLDL